MDFHTDHQFPVLFCTCDGFDFRRVVGQIEHVVIPAVQSFVCHRSGRVALQGAGAGLDGAAMVVSRGMGTPKVWRCSGSVPHGAQARLAEIGALQVGATFGKARRYWPWARIGECVRMPT